MVWLSGSKARHTIPVRPATHSHTAGIVLQQYKSLAKAAEELATNVRHNSPQPFNQGQQAGANASKPEAKSSFVPFQSDGSRPMTSSRWVGGDCTLLINAYSCVYCMDYMIIVFHAEVLGMHTVPMQALL